MLTADGCSSIGSRSHNAIAQQLHTCVEVGMTQRVHQRTHTLPQLSALPCLNGCTHECLLAATIPD
jgi:hypothetical protein